LLALKLTVAARLSVRVARADGLKQLYSFHDELRKTQTERSKHGAGTNANTNAF